MKRRKRGAGDAGGFMERNEHRRRPRKEKNMTDQLGVTPAQHRLLQFLRERELLDLPAPSMDEMAAALGLKSKSGAHRLVAGLEERGHIRRIGRRRRSVQVVHPAHPVADQLREALVAAVAALPEGSRLTPGEVLALIRDRSKVLR